MVVVAVVAAQRGLRGFLFERAASQLHSGVAQRPEGDGEQAFSPTPAEVIRLWSRAAPRFLPPFPAFTPRWDATPAARRPN